MSKAQARERRRSLIRNTASCPKCGAFTGTRCRDGSNRPMDRVHLERSAENNRVALENVRHR